MPNLAISLTGDSYTREQKELMWSKINYGHQCPECGSIASFLQGPHGGFAFNIKCTICATVFWLTPHIAFGAYPVSRG